MYEVYCEVCIKLPAITDPCESIEFAEWQADTLNIFAKQAGDPCHFVVREVESNGQV